MSYSYAPMLAPLVTIDIGNSRVKVGVFDRAISVSKLVEPSAVSRWRHGDEPLWPAVVPERVLVGSVAPKVSGPIVDHLPNDWPRPEIVVSTMFGLAFDVDEPERVGIDRVANAAAAAVLAPRDDVVVVDAGSAITVDLVTRDDDVATFRGGAIFPGLQMSADALTVRTELLPRIDMSQSEGVVWPGKNTVDAIRVGVRDAARGSVFHFVSRFRARHTPHCRQLVCGGDAAEFTMGLDEREVFESLTLSGLALASLQS